MISRDLRHPRDLLAVAEKASMKQAAECCHMSQPAVTQSISKLEQAAGGLLFTRTRQEFYATVRADVLAVRVRRACAHLDPALAEVAPCLNLTATTAQLKALIAVRDSESFSLAARGVGLAQPTVYRAVIQQEQVAGRSLFERTAFNLVATRQCQALAQAAQSPDAEMAGSLVRS